jgi:hypothetical protein
VLKAHLNSRITWAQYNLVTDASFNEFQMILGHRALPDFGPSLRKRVLQLFDDSLAPFGMLALIVRSTSTTRWRAITKPSWRTSPGTSGRLIQPKRWAVRQCGRAMPADAPCLPAPAGISSARAQTPARKRR